MISGATNGGSFLLIFSESFSKKFGKKIDGKVTKVLVGNLSLIGKLFEIYFVRLIGTPNQQFKKTISASAEITLVVQNH